MERAERRSHGGIVPLLAATLLTVLTLAACQKIELDTAADEQTPTEEPQPPTSIIRAGTEGVRPCGIDIDTNVTRNGNEYNPYLPYDMLTKAENANGPTPWNNVWFYGYAVGYINSIDDSCFTATGAVADNILISDEQTECTPANTLLVELQDDAMQQAMSLKARPDRLGHLVRFNGRTVNKGLHGGYCLQTSAKYSADWLIEE